MNPQDGLTWMEYKRDDALWTNFLDILKHAVDKYLILGKPINEKNPFDGCPTRYSKFLASTREASIPEGKFIDDKFEPTVIRKPLVPELLAAGYNTIAFDDNQGRDARTYDSSLKGASIEIFAKKPKKGEVKPEEKEEKIKEPEVKLKIPRKLKAGESKLKQSYLNFKECKGRRPYVGEVIDISEDGDASPKKKMKSEEALDDIELDEEDLFDLALDV